MENILIFFVENSLWIILIASFLMLALVGYAAEKSGFKKQDKKEEKEKVKEAKEEKLEQAEEIISEPVIDFNNFSEAIEEIKEEVIEEKDETSASVEELPLVEEIKELDPSIVLDEASSPKKRGRKPKKKEETNDEIQTLEIKEPTLDAKIEETLEDLSEPLPGMVKEEIQEEIPEELYTPIEEVKVTGVEAELPNLDEVKDTKEEVTSEDDIWKF